MRNAAKRGFWDRGGVVANREPGLYIYVYILLIVYMHITTVYIHRYDIHVHIYIYTHLDTCMFSLFLWHIYIYMYIYIWERISASIFCSQHFIYKSYSYALEHCFYSRLSSLVSFKHLTLQWLDLSMYLKWGPMHPSKNWSNWFPPRKCQDICGRQGLRWGSDFVKRPLKIQHSQGTTFGVLEGYLPLSKNASFVCRLALKSTLDGRNPPTYQLKTVEISLSTPSIMF